MFNRTLKFEVVKTPKSESQIAKEHLTENERIERLVYWQAFTRSIVKDAAKLAAGYMILDTWRKATIAKAAGQACCNCLTK